MGSKGDAEGAEELPALFWDEIPENAAENPDYAAIQSLIYDESTPEETVENFKNQGNDRLKRAIQVKNKIYFDQAIEFYTKGIDYECKNDSLRAILFTNRSQAHIHLGNWRKALKDSKEAVRLDPNNIKAWYRGARSALKLQDVDETLRFCEKGLEVDPDNVDLKKLSKDAVSRRAIIVKEKAAAKEKQDALIAKATEMADHLLRRGIRLCQPNFNVGEFYPYLDEDSVMHWPVLFVYPETMQQDFIQDVEEIDPIETQLDIMFGPEAEPISWDADKEYRRDTVDVYYLANAGKQFTRDELISTLAGQFSGDLSEYGPKQYGDDAICWVKVEEWKTMRDVLEEPGHIVPGVPTFFIVARGSKYHERFLASKDIPFQKNSDFTIPI
ncbi:hypothetical protein BSKO_08529 [Bryopsis sp. KO-2023]|nr:hypothetical protein BSKO_08529 [Bryopsis sp. KO-2023]